MAILETLARDHRTLEEILSELAATTTAEAARRTEIFTRLQSLLQAHSRAEEEVVYRRLHAKLPDEALPLEAYEEHHVADILLQELASACPGGVGWTAKVMVLGELLRHHIKEEEVDLFALVRENFDDAEQARMDEEFRMLKHEPVEALLAPLRRATPAFAGRASITAQAAAGRLARRGELYLRKTFSGMRRANPVVTKARPDKARSRSSR
ncbi:MAG TPA: hemerythrin domain-containing protein [Nevskiaceae bacterium]|nr:hemerythrin domain-containing protein [Nevskiaceae bacterium]